MYPIDNLKIMVLYCADKYCSFYQKVLSDFPELVIGVLETDFQIDLKNCIAQLGRYGARSILFLVDDLVFVDNTDIKSFALTLLDGTVCICSMFVAYIDMITFKS